MHYFLAQDLRRIVDDHPDGDGHATGQAPEPTRRGFLEILGRGGAAALGAGVLALAGCRDSVTNPVDRPAFALRTPSGPLNLVYAYAQLLADFYARAANSPYFGGEAHNFVGMTALEYSVITAIGTHKNAQRNALVYLVTASRAPDVLLFDYSTLDFSSRASVMGHAQTFEDLGVAMLNGLGPSIQNATDLTLIAKIASNWARHGAVIRDLNDIAAGNADTPKRTSFAGTTSAGGLDPTIDAAAFVAAVQPYFRSKLTVS